MSKTKHLFIKSSVVLSMFLAPFATNVSNVTTDVYATPEDSSTLVTQEQAVPMGRDEIYDDNYALPQWNHNLMNIGAARQEGLTGAGISIAVLDTGFYADHPDMNFAGGQSLFEDDEWTNDHTGHGTHVAGIIGASANSAYPGVAPDASIYGIKVYHKDEVGEAGEPLTDIENIAEGIRTAANMGVNIILISSGVAANDSNLHAAVQYAQSTGALIIAAAGNGGAFVQYPAAYPEVVAVSSVDANGTPAGDIIYGAENELAAPGVGITSLSTPDNPYGYPYVVMSGSSQAAPHVAGLAALLMQKYGTNAATIREMLHEGAYDLGEANLFGFGLAGFLSEGVIKAPEAETPIEEEEEKPEQEEKDETTEDNEKERKNKERLARVFSQSDQDVATYEESKKSKQKHNYLVIVPTADKNIASFETDAIQYVKENGALYIDMGDLANESAKLRIRKEQARLLREKNISLILLHDQFDWTIPAKNLTAHNWTFAYEEVHQEFKNEHSIAYRFTVKQGEKEITEFKEPLAFRYYFNDSMKDFNLYHLVDGKWTSFEGDRTAEHIAFQTNSLPQTFGLLAKEELKAKPESEKTEKNKEAEPKKKAAKVYQTIKLAAGVLTALLLLFFFINHFRRQKDQPTKR